MNRASLQTFRQQAEKVRAELREGLVKLNGIEYACAMIVGPIRPEWDDKTMMTRTVQTAVARVRKDLLAACPSIGVKVVARGLEWFVETLGNQDDSSVTWSLHLKRIITKAGT